MKSVLKAVIGILLLLVPVLLSGCTTITGSGRNGVILARRAQIRSSYAVVAAELLEVNRGDTVQILEETEIADQNREDVKERWFRVRFEKDKQDTEGWIEARNVIPEEMLDQSRKLSIEDKDTPSQAAGQLRASSNLRLTPDYTNNENILMMLESGSVFEIVSWKRLQKPVSPDIDVSLDRDDTPKGRTKRRSGRQKNEEENLPEETTDLWYKVRLNSSVSPAPSGWIYGKQVELKVPSDIIFYRTGREFVAWRRLDADADSTTTEGKDKDAGKEEKPGSWVILEKGASDGPRKIDEPEFDRIYVLGYDKYDQKHYTAYHSPDLLGFLPLQVEGKGSNKTFTAKIMINGELKDVQFTMYKDNKGHLRVTAPPEVDRIKRK